MGLPGNKRLLREGEKAEGIVTETGITGYTLRVVFPDGDQRNVRVRGFFGNELGDPQVGHKYPVRYDPDDHSKVVVDKPALDAKKDQAAREFEQSQRAAADRAVRKLAGEKSDDGVPTLSPGVAESDPELAEMVEAEKRERDAKK